MRFSRFLSKGKLKMRDSLFVYMMILTVVILVVIAFGMIMLGTFAKPSDTFANTLKLQMEVFEKEITSHHEELAMRAANLSSEASRILSHYLRTNGLDFEDLDDSPEHIADIQRLLLDLLKDEILKSESSGIFIMLDTTVNSNSNKDGHSRSGLYVQRGSQNLSDETLLLFRGDAAIGKEASVMPHRKWQLEFDTRLFPDYEEILKIAPDVPLEAAYNFTDIVTIPGTSENATLLTVPILGTGGNVVGVCGFEISEHAFKMKHAQSTILEHLMCLWLTSRDNISADNAMICGTEDGYFLPPAGNIKISKADDGLLVFETENEIYIGLAGSPEYDTEGKNVLLVMMPKKDFDKAVSTNAVQIVVFLILLSSFAISLCRILSKRFMKPIMEGLEQIRRFEHSQSDSRFLEISDLFGFLSDKDKEYEIAYEELSEEKEKAETELARVQGEIEKLSYSRKNEINPEDYENFAIGIKTLTKSERNIFEMYLAGKTAKEIIEITGIKESTLKFHNGNIYEKLGVSSRKQMLRYAALYTQDNGGKI
ncbi:MAG: helix-turn-helix transcriptional regulator [Ruminococcaceae bacterium]|nr:helix-turn-helix transcriptional regulator [Oscillospiraceae bacterium]